MGPPFSGTKCHFAAGKDGELHQGSRQPFGSARQSAERYIGCNQPSCLPVDRSHSRLSSLSALINDFGHDARPSIAQWSSVALIASRLNATSMSRTIALTLIWRQLIVEPALNLGSKSKVLSIPFK